MKLPVPPHVLSEPPKIVFVDELPRECSSQRASVLALIATGGLAFFAAALAIAFAKSPVTTASANVGAPAAMMAPRAPAAAQASEATVPVPETAVTFVVGARRTAPAPTTVRAKAPARALETELETTLVKEPAKEKEESSSPSKELDALLEAQLDSSSR